MIREVPKFCRDCVYFAPGWWARWVDRSLLEFAECRHPAFEPDASPVTGNRQPVSCRDALTRFRSMSCWTPRDNEGTE